MSAASFADLQPSPDSFAAILRQFREHAGLSQRTLSKRAGFCPQYVGRLEQDENGPSVDAVARLSSALALRPAAHERFANAANGGTSPMALLSRPVVTKLNAAYRAASPEGKAGMDEAVSRLIKLGATAHEQKRGGAENAF